mmetsp:Transcript_10908/g.17855  ORF Transcript_10908/g.17855 Transcript_10908/m.17855 type:complete len:162 (+) Transcript_10908:761-1246(+)|eukprot:CAMPEP_0184666002 /NCGR_PEP_ID=MMETSP0308-20130426/59616_1 /TAXON_ID=38269 /ORGANISM="Gloeochaete witrockiana, Strain SAG 46.84" /LENGTH=161 /DNA_ID=CAMNT_0027110347 /DNA_START=649 /DNA_END=1134 /DNA_ORIENTATION=-
MEDDILPSDDIKSVSDLHLLMKSALEYVNDDYDVLYLGHCSGRKRKHKPVTTMEIGNTTWSIHKKARCMCTHAYAVSKRGADKILTGLATIDKAVDMALMEMSRHNAIKAYAVFPPIFEQFWQNKARAEKMELICSDGKYRRHAGCLKSDGQISSKGMIPQ